MKGRGDSAPSKGGDSLNTSPVRQKRGKSQFLGEAPKNGSKTPQRKRIVTQIKSSFTRLPMVLLDLRIKAEGGRLGNVPSRTKQ